MFECRQYADHRQSFSLQSNSKIIYTWISSTNGMHVYLQNVIMALCLHVLCSTGHSHAVQQARRSFRINCISYLEKPINCSPAPLPLHPLNVSSLNYNVGVNAEPPDSVRRLGAGLWLVGQQHLTINIYRWRHQHYSGGCWGHLGRHMFKIILILNCTTFIPQPGDLGYVSLPLHNQHFTTFRMTEAPVMWCSK